MAKVPYSEDIIATFNQSFSINGESISNGWIRNGSICFVFQ